MMRPTPTLKRVSESSPSLLVRVAMNLFMSEGKLIKPPELELDEEGTRISLTIVDTPGFGDQIDNEAR
jgi:septin family protein